MKHTFLLIVLSLLAISGQGARSLRKADPVDKAEDKKDEVISNCVKKLKCENTLMNVQTCMAAAKEAGMIPSAEIISKEFSNCKKQQLLEKAAGGDDANPYGPNRKMPNATVRLQDDLEHAKNRTDLNLYKWEAFPVNEEHKVLLTDSVGVSIHNYKWQETNPDLTLNLVDGKACKVEKNSGDETVTSETTPYKCQQWCLRKANEANEKAQKDKKQQVFKGCFFERSTSKCTVSANCQLIPSNGFHGATFKKVYEEKIMGSHTGGSKGYNSVVFDGNSHNVSGNGVSLDSAGHRALVSRPLDLRDGGVVSFFMKDGPDDGGQRCARVVTEMRKQHAEAAQRRRDEFARRESCASKGPEGKGCSGHGTGHYVSSCDSKWYCDKAGGRPFDPTCHCKCNQGFIGPRCEIQFVRGHCRSVGYGHPSTAEGFYYNLYDAGEFVYFKHPESKVEVHALFRMMNSHMAGTSAIAVRVCENPLKEADRGKCDTITFEAQNCATNGQNKVTVAEDGKCVPGNKYNKGEYRTANTNIVYNGHKRIYASDNSYINIGGTHRAGWYHDKNGAGGCTKGGACKSSYGCGNYGGYMNVYNNIMSPRDGKAVGMCGDFSGSRSKDQSDLMEGGARKHWQMGVEFRNKIKVTPKNSLFKCGDFVDPTYTYTYYPKFKSLAGQLVSAAKKASAGTEALVEELAVGADDIKKPEISKKLAEQKCKESNKKTGLATMTEEALENCIQDMMILNDDAVKKNAVDESEEEIEEAFEEAEADEKDMAQELVAERKLHNPTPLDLVLQYCTSGCETSSNWKQIRAYPAKLYSKFTENWQEFTASIPKAAMTANTRIRFYQKQHTCYCCNVFAIDDIKVTTGGWPVRVIADKKFTMYADGALVGSGQWYEATKDTYRYRVDPKTEVFAIKIEGDDEGRMGVIGSFGESLVTSSSWKCKSRLSTKEAASFANPDFDDSQWPSAFEQGQNGMLPWGERPGIAKSAFWIFTSDAYKTKSETAYCRVNTNKAWHSYDKTHLAASRWSCKSMQERQSPYVIPLDSEKMSMITIANGENAQTHYSAKETESTSRKGYEENKILLRLKVRKIMEKTVVGEMIKQANLRLYVTDASQRDFKVCRNMKQYSAATVTYDSSPTVQKDDCISVNANKINTWANIDLSEWIRDWVTDPVKHNFGITIEGQSRDLATFATHLSKDTTKRPRLSLSCHGDRVAAEAVFKESKAELKSQHSIKKLK